MAFRHYSKHGYLRFRFLRDNQDRSFLNSEEITQTMARTREFDPDLALEKAMRFFWRKGYNAAAMREIVTHTKVAHAGLYSAFGGKEQLFQAALQRYFDTVLAGLLHELAQPEASRAAIEHLFATLLAGVQAGQWPNGCLMCNTAAEFGGQPGPIQTQVNHQFARMQTLFQRALTQAKANGEVRATLPVEATAALFVTLFVGSALLVRTHAPFVQIEQGVQAALQLLD